LVLDDAGRHVELVERFTDRTDPIERRQHLGLLDTRFATDWATRDGRTQSRVFMDLVSRTPPRGIHEIARELLSSCMGLRRR